MVAKPALMAAVYRLLTKLWEHLLSGGSTGETDREEIRLLEAVS
jgi:hypothetical protein